MDAGPRGGIIPGYMHNEIARRALPDVLRPQLEPNGIRRLQLYEPPAPEEVVVGASSGSVELTSGEGADAFKRRADKLMFEKKETRKRLGLRKDRESAD